jgi:hypothetical protein
MHQVAQETGGHADTNTNDLASAAQKDLDDGSSYYTISYTPTDPKFDGSYRTIKVALAQPHLTLAYRRGYLTDDAKHPPKTVASDLTPAQQQIAHAMLHGMPTPTGLIVKAFVGPASQPNEQRIAENNPAPLTLKGPFQLFSVNYAASFNGLTYTKVSDDAFRIDVEFLAYLYDPNGALLNSTANTLHATLTRDQIRNSLKTGIPFHQTISVPAKGDYYLRIAVHDTPSNKLGVIEIPIDTVRTLPIVPPPPPPPAPASL